MLKRIGAMAVMAIMLLTALCNFSFATAEENKMHMVLTPSTQRAKRGTTVTVAISIENYQPIQSVGILVDYDKDVLTYTGEAFSKFAGVEGGDYMSAHGALQFTNKNYTKDGVNEILAAWVNTKNIVLSDTANGKLNLWSVTFTVNEDAVIDETVLNFSLAEAHVMYWDDEQEKSVFLEPGTDYVVGAQLSVEIYCEHSYGEWEIVTLPTFIAEGLKQHTCSLCGNVEQQAIPMLPCFELTPVTSKAVVGAEWLVDLAVKRNPGIGSAKIKVDYDDTAILLTAATASDTIIEISEDGHEIAVISATGLYGEEAIIRLAFAVSKDAAAGNYDITVSTDDAVDNAEDPGDLVIGNGTAAAEILEYLWGDVTQDGTIDSADAVSIVQYVVGNRAAEDLSGAQAADTDFNNKINLADAVYVLRYLVKLYTPDVAL